MTFTVTIPDTLLPGFEYLRRKHEIETGSPLTLPEFVAHTVVQFGGNAVLQRDRARMDAFINGYRRADPTTQSKAMSDAALTLGITLP